METNLERFKEAQKESYPRAYEELKSGKKKTHWMWYIFPQIKGLGHSANATYYAIEDISEAIAYLEDEELYTNLVSLCEILLEPDKCSIGKIFGRIDTIKLQSSMTLFSYATEIAEAKHLREESTGMPELFSKSSKHRETDRVFDAVLDKFYNGEKDHSTESILFFDNKSQGMEVFTLNNTKQM